MNNLHGRWSLTFLIFFFGFISTIARAELVPDIVSPPTWVTELNPKADFDLPVDTIQGGVYYLLADTQIKVDEGRPPHHFYHYADFIANQSGVQNNSQINISYDPLYEEVQLHKISIIRNNIRIDKSQTSEKNILQREQELDELIYSGLHTLNIILDDVRIGDVVEYSYSLIGANPVFRNYFSYHHALQWQMPVEDLSIRLLWNKNTSITPTLRNSSARLSINESDSGTEYLLREARIKGQTVDDDAPSWFSPWGHIYFSELDSWSQVVDWGITLYNGAYQSNAEINKLVENIKSKTSDKKEQIYEALKFTQSEIRYMGIELGSNSHIPSTASETLARRYGDCKDKTVLLIAILKKLGIEAHPTLVNTDLKAEILNRPASPRLFNHVITKVYIENKAIYLDPTRSYQYGNLDSIYYPNYGGALELKPGIDALTTLPPASNNSSIDIYETFTLASSPTGSTQSETTAIYKGWNAERQRSNFNETGKQGIQKSYLEFFERYYPGSDVRSPMHVQDDQSQNTFTITEFYRIQNVWERHETVTGRYEGTFYANIVNSYIPFQDNAKRNSPLKISHPLKVSQTITINLPNDDWSFEDEQFKKRNEHFEFDYNASFDANANVLTLVYRYETKASEVTPEKYPEFFEALESVSGYLSYGMYWNLNSAAEATDGFVPTPMHVVAIICALFLLVVILWRVDKKRNPEPETGTYYPVSLAKFVALWVLSYGFYGVYWFYRNFKYIKLRDNKPSMPLARGIFSQFWYYKLWKDLSHDSRERYDENHLPAKPLGVSLAVLYFATVFSGLADSLIIPSLFLASFIVLPLANYIAFANKDSEAMKHNSRWTLHHYLLTIVAIPLLCLSFTSEVGLTPSSKVIVGEKLLDWDIKKLHQKGVISPEEGISYFYSDGFLSIQEDGNGFTDKGVFSYWQDENSGFNMQRANYNEIADIKVNLNKTPLSNSTVLIVREDGSEFVLYVSNTEQKDLIFIDKLKEAWKENR